ncbi:MAG: hypothetical protein EOP92_02715 [Lysobacteraceae bacterium]|nr:MAG: hypothetical protein EOP92_02715 [Xanthomonadaceae bacterium]
MRDPTQPTDGADMDGESNPYAPRASTRRDVSHDRQLLRDLETINARVVQELGPLPVEGLPVVARRKPVLSRVPLPPAHSATLEDDAMTLNPILVAASLALTACAPANESTNAQRNDTAGEKRETDSPSLRHKFRINPQPKRRYDITMTIRDAPGPFGMVKFWAHYLAPDCMYWTDKFAGTTGRPTHTIEMPFQKLDDTTYVGTVYLDGMLDEDYYGDGVCHWQLSEVAVGLQATGAQDETGFVPDVGPDSVVSQESVTKYFWKGGYPNSRIPSYSDFGFSDPQRYKPEIQDELFSITLDSKEVHP